MTDLFLPSILIAQYFVHLVCKRAAHAAPEPAFLLIPQYSPTWHHAHFQLR